MTITSTPREPATWHRPAPGAHGAPWAVHPAWAGVPRSCCCSWLATAAGWVMVLCQLACPAIRAHRDDRPADLPASPGR